MESGATEKDCGENKKFEEIEQQSVSQEAESSEGKGSTEDNKERKKFIIRKEKRGRLQKSETWVKARTSSEGDIREIFNKKRELSSPEEIDKIVKKTATEENMGDNYEEYEKQYEKATDRQILFELLKRMDNRDKEREVEKARFKEEMKQEVRGMIAEEKLKWEEKSRELEQKMEKKFKEWEERRQDREEIQNQEENGIGLNAKDESEVEKKMREVEKRCERLEMDERKKCVIIRGLQKTKRGLEKEMEEFFESKLDVKVKVQQANLIGYEKKLVWVKLSTFEDKEKVMENKKKLGAERVFIEHDRTREERDIQRAIARKAKELKERNQNVKIGFKKLEVDGVKYRWSEREKKLMKEVPVFQIELENEMQM